MSKKNKLKELLTQEEYKQLQEGFIPLQKWDKIMKPLIEEVRESSMITSEDLKTRINT